LGGRAQGLTPEHLALGARGAEGGGRSPKPALLRPPPLTTLRRFMTSPPNGSLRLSQPQEAATERAPPDAGGPEHFLNLVQRAPRFDGARRYLQKDLAAAFGQLVHHDASVMEAGVGGGKLLGSLPNAVRWGVDILPEAVTIARELDPTMH